MVSLLDIAEVKETVPLRGQEVEVNGITAEHLVTLFHSYPELRRLVTGNASAETVQSLINQAPIAISHVIALGMAGIDAEEAKVKAFMAAARKLGAGEQYVILEKIGTLTFPQGPKSFLDRVGAALGVQPGALGWAPGMKSQPQSSAASPPADQSETVGDQHPSSSTAG